MNAPVKISSYVLTIAAIGIISYKGTQCSLSEPRVRVKIECLPSGQKVYTSEYLFERNQGLVRVKDDITWNQSSYPADSKNLKIIIKRHCLATAVITALLGKEVVKLADKSGEDNYKEYGWLWVPWTDDTAKDRENYFKQARNDKLRGDNRLELVIREPGEYTITIPQDADIELKVTKGDIEYKEPPASTPTLLHIEGTKVNRCGDTGFPGTEIQLWDYYWGDERKDPKTNLVTKNGSVVVPD
jgi:hypothetical protein